MTKYTTQHKNKTINETIITQVAGVDLLIRFGNFTERS